MNQRVRVVGGGLAGTEAAFRLAERGFFVELWEMRPCRGTEAHKTSDLAELVCSNSFKSLSLATAPGLLKAEMQLLGSLAISAAREASVSAGEALAVDRDIFSQAITRRLEAHPRIKIQRAEFNEATLLAEVLPTIIATGPLTSPALSAWLEKVSGEAEFYFYDAISPVVATSSIDFSVAFMGNRHDKPSRTLESDTAGTTDAAGDYINCPMNLEEYMAFIAALAKAERVEPKSFERVKHFEGCMPIEEMLDRGPETLRYGPMRPIGLTDPRTGRRPWAVVQLRAENRERTMYNLVGFQTKMKYGAQKEVLRLIPGLEKAEFMRMGSMHRNAFVNAPKVLAPNLSLRAHPRTWLAGQITGVEGYMESAATGILAAIFLEAELMGRPAPLPARASAMGSLLSHLQNQDSPDFQPMGINFGLFTAPEFIAATAPEAPAPGKRIKKIAKADKRERIGAISLANAKQFAQSLELVQNPLNFRSTTAERGDSADGQSANRPD